MSDALLDLAQDFADRLADRAMARDELVQEFLRFGQRVRDTEKGDDPKLKLVMHIDGAQFMSEGPASMVRAALDDWKETAGFYEQASRKAFPVTKGFNRPMLTSGR